jgi:hypothetical protein
MSGALSSFLLTIRLNFSVCPASLCELFARPQRIEGGEKDMPYYGIQQISARKFSLEEYGRCQPHEIT